MGEVAISGRPQAATTRRLMLLRASDSNRAQSAMNDQLAVLESSISQARNQLLEHPLYTRISDLASVRGFMQFHAFAVWDFMSLTKALQQQLTCTQVPWVPNPEPELARFINEIVLGEESDEDGNGGFTSHYELYLAAMREVGADTARITGFVERVQKTDDFDGLIARLAPEGGVFAFVDSTFSMIRRGTHAAAASFLFGREDVIPEMFAKVLEQEHLHEDARYRSLRWYLERHIELDGDHHGPLARRLLRSLCGDSDEKWEEARLAAEDSIAARIRLWDYVCGALG